MGATRHRPVWWQSRYIIGLVVTANVRPAVTYLRSMVMGVFADILTTGAEQGYSFPIVGGISVRSCLEATLLQS